MANCVVCNKEFAPHRPCCICCSSQCSAIRYRQTHPVPRKAKTKQCCICGADFIALPPNRRTCNVECGRKLYNGTSARHYATKAKGRQEPSDAELDQRALADLDRLRAGDTYRPQRSAITEMQRWV